MNVCYESARVYACVHPYIRVSVSIFPSVCVLLPSSLLSPKFLHLPVSLECILGSVCVCGWDIGTAGPLSLQNKAWGGGEGWATAAAAITAAP